MEVPIEPIVIGTILQILVTLALVAWGRWVARRMGNGRGWRFASALPWVSLVLLTIGTIVGVIALIRAFESASAGDAAYKAQRLAQAISNAMNLSALFFLPGYLSLFASLIAFAIGSLARPASPPP